MPWILKVWKFFTREGGGRQGEGRREGQRDRREDEEEETKQTLKHCSL
jgi:hypothetical protein